MQLIAATAATASPSAVLWLLWLQASDGPQAEAQAIRLATQLAEQGALRGFGKAAQVRAGPGLLAGGHTARATGPLRRRQCLPSCGTSSPPSKPSYTPPH